MVYFLLYSCDSYPHVSTQYPVAIFIFFRLVSQPPLTPLHPSLLELLLRSVRPDYFDFIRTCIYY